MKEHIKKELRRIEQEKDIKILYACETGSRAWGFASPDSDYDVRMLYVHRLDWYLSLSPKKDTIQLMIEEGDLDITGWELKKALNLMWKSNGSMMERIQSPIVYINDEKFIAKINELARGCFSPIATMHHYLSMTKKAFEEVTSSESYKLKRLFYALRGALACKWIVDKNSIVPIVFDEMLQGLEIDKKLKNRIEELIGFKATKSESYLHSGEKELMDMIKQIMEKSDLAAKNLGSRVDGTVDLDSFFSSTLKSAW